LSLRHIEEMMQERGVSVDHSTVHRWAITMLPVLAAIFRRRKRVDQHVGLQMARHAQVPTRDQFHLCQHRQHAQHDKDTGQKPR